MTELEDYIERGLSAGCPPEQIEKFVRAGVACWVFRASPIYELNCIYCKDGALSLVVHGGYEYRANVTLWDGTGAAVVDLVGTDPLEVEVWTHLAVTKSGGDVRIYRDGVLDVSGTVSGVVAEGNQTRIGAADSGYPWSGLIDEVGFWSRALSDEEIGVLYGSGAGMTYEDF